jgi:6,7-dimethyl-8-ribityllumazine synthase
MGASIVPGYDPRPANRAALFRMATNQEPSPHDARPSADLDGRGLRVAVLVALWYRELTDRLRAAALETLRSAGVAEDDVLVVEVPGAFELPQAAAYVARAGLADAIVALGCVVRGETPHFEHVCRCASDGLLRAGQDSGIPVALGVITADTLDQARARAGEARGKGGNKGTEAAEAAVRLAGAYRALDARSRERPSPPRRGAP